MAAASAMQKRGAKGGKRRNERNILTFYEKIAVIRYYDETNISRNSLAKMFHCCATQIRRILERKEELMEQLNTLSETDASTIFEEMTRKRRKFEMSAISFILHQWVERCRWLRLRQSITNQTLKETAFKMAAILNLPSFRPSYRWLNRFRGKYRYHDDDIGMGADQQTTGGELAVEDIIIEFKDALPSFMQKEISAITSSCAKVEELSVINAALPHQDMSSDDNSLDYEVDLTDEDDDDAVQIVSLSPSEAAAPLPNGAVHSRSSSVNTLSSEHANNNASQYATEACASDDNAVLEMRIRIFPHLAVVHQFALLNSDIKAVELISQLGVHMQMQAAQGFYKQLSVTTTQTTQADESGADEMAGTISIDHLDDIVLID